MTAQLVEQTAAQAVSVELPAKEVLAAIRATALAAGSDDSLPVLTAIKLTLLERGLIMVATDRYRLVETKHGLGAELGTALVRAKDLAAFAKSLKIPTGYLGQGATVSLAIDGDTVTVSGLGSSRTFRVIDGTFPPHAHLLEREVGGVERIGFSPVYLADGADACRIMAGGDKSVPCRLTFSGANKPVIMEPHNPLEGWAFRYLLMPMRLA